MNLDQYFEMPTTPSKGSPVGLLMQRILEESPDLTFEDARALAHAQMLKASGRRVYRVTTPAEDKKRAASRPSRVDGTPETAIAAA